MIYYDLTSSILSFSRPRPAGSHCENSGSSDGSGASARSGRAKQRSLLCPLSERGWRHPYFSPCLIFWCFWIKPKAQKKSEIDSLFLWESSVPLIGCFLRGADLPPFLNKRWRQKCPQGEKVGERPTACARVFDGAAAARSSSRFSAMRSLLCASRNNDLLRFEFLSSHLAGFRPAGSHCENSGKSDDTCASARSDRAKSAVFRDRSANAGVVARYFSRYLIFWCFWIKPKAQEKI